MQIQKQVEGFRNWVEIFGNYGHYQNKLYFYNKQTQQISMEHPRLLQEKKGIPRNIKLNESAELYVDILKTILKELEIALEINDIEGQIDYFSGPIEACPNYN